MTNDLKILLCGCSGRMGAAVRKVAEESEAWVVAGVDTFANCNDCYFNIKNYHQVHILDFNKEPANVIINFLPPTASDEIIEILEYSAEHKIPHVICTTGLPSSAEAAITKAVEKTAVLRSANMSLGVNLLSNIVNQAAQLLYSSGFNIEIIEKHHNQKIDSPSGTALLFADSINTALDNKMQYVHDRSKSCEKRRRDEIGIHALRGGTIVGEHSIIFAGRDEVIEFSHSALSRDVFAVGAIKAAEFLLNKSPGLYSMQDMMKI